MKREIELVLDIKADLGEGVFWDYKKRFLYWVDIEKGELHIYNPGTRENKTYDIGERIGTVVPASKGKLILALENSIAEYNTEKKELKKLIAFEEDIPENRANDGKCDPSGRFWVGSLSMDNKAGNANLYRIGKDLKLHKMLSGVSVSNGLVWSLDKKKMYYIDTPTREIVSFDYDNKSGDIANKRTVIKIPELMGYPDGMTIDEKGMLWIALFGGWGVSRWDPLNRKLLEYIKLPVQNVTSCTFGGDNLNELYITTASFLLKENEIKNQPHAGGLFRLKTNICGLPCFEFISK